MLRSQPTALNALKQRAMLPMQPVRGLRLQASPKMKMPVPVRNTLPTATVYSLLTILQKEEHSGL